MQKKHDQKKIDRVLVIFLTLRPFEFMIYRLEGVLEESPTSRLKTICEPSGDHDGSSSMPLLYVNRVRRLE